MLPAATNGAVLHDFGAIQAMRGNQIPENKVNILLPSQDTDCERFEPRSHFKSRLSLIIRVNIVLNRTVVVDSD